MYIYYAHDFQNLVAYSIPYDTSLTTFHEDSISSYYVKLPTDRQTDSQTQGKHNLLIIIIITINQSINQFISRHSTKYIGACYSAVMPNQREMS